MLTPTTCMHADAHIRASTITGQAGAPRSIEAVLAAFSDTAISMPDLWTEGLGGRVTTDSALLSPHDLEGDMPSITGQGQARATFGKLGAAHASSEATAASGADMHLRVSVTVKIISQLGFGLVGMYMVMRKALVTCGCRTGSQAAGSVPLRAMWQP